MRELRQKLTLVLFIMLWVAVGKFAQANPTQIAQHKVEVETLDVFDNARNRPVKITLWYPAESECDNARICLANSTQLNHAVILSHGAMGSAKDYNWIGYALASQGIVVAGVNHYGESYLYGQEHVDYSAALRFWQRPRDVSFVLDILSKNVIENQQNAQIFNKNINWSNVIGIGHSSGGATMIAAIGGKVDLTQSLEYCAKEISTGDKSCQYMRHLTKSFNYENTSNTDFLDPRIARVIALDPALGHVMTTESLQNIKVPTLIIGSTENDFLPFDSHAGVYAQTIPNTQLLSLDKGEGHFVYLDSCDHKFKAMGVSLCEDKLSINRDLVHQNIYPSLFQFVYSN
ncbi:alpha/beta hydrolase family protein [Glaciecola sp. 2405UD65-10]|uniref:alpha/beta hydrolase family protein n=1 Tax=Glaciecola sp. 2405UD65-10 TaxID=3397244 RepID=UPI003B59A6E8